MDDKVGIKNEQWPQTAWWKTIKTKFPNAMSVRREVLRTRPRGKTMNPKSCMDATNVVASYKWTFVIVVKQYSSSPGSPAAIVGPLASLLLPSVVVHVVVLGRLSRASWRTQEIRTGMHRHSWVDAIPPCGAECHPGVVAVSDELEKSWNELGIVTHFRIFWIVVAGKIHLR